ncbi:MAG: hydrogenase [Clostridiales bacterium]|jgi:hydrogenase-4 component E|nr:hydrogenase [Clostridiales bacterium]
MSSLFDILSVMILLSSFVLMANKRIKSYIKTFRIQSLLIAIVAGILGIQLIINEGRVDVLIVCIIIVLLKVIYIPNLLRRTYLGVEHRVEKDFIWNIPILVLICCGLVVFIYFSITAIEGISEDISTIQLVNSVSVVLIGLFFMISRKKAIGLIIGFLELENGIFVTAMFATDGMPFIVDLGIFIDMLTAVMIMGVMVFRISDKFDTINIDELNKLKG